MRLSIDPDRCTGHGRCYDVAPDLVDEDEIGNGRVTVPDPAPEQVAAAERAVTSCPERAVSLTEQEG